MNIMVFDVPAEKGGALSILKDFYNEVRHFKDRSINWIFVVSKVEIQETENIKVLRFPWIKKSWGHRLYFDTFKAAKLVKKYDIDKIISFQNVVIPNTNVPQILYVHQSLPFVSYKFSFKDNKLFWIYQNIIGKKIIKSIQQANEVIVQTKWMKDACIEKAGIDRVKVNVISPTIDQGRTIKKYFKLNKKSHSTFFYPANGGTYKNHKVIVEATKVLRAKGVKDFKVFFTLKGNENQQILDMFEMVKEEQLPIEFIGSIEQEEVFEYYSRSILLFPSFIETFGLPLLEARLHKGIILASNCVFSREILNDYENVYFFDPFDVNELASYMEKLINNDIEYKNIKNKISLDKLNTSILEVLIKS